MESPPIRSPSSLSELTAKVRLVVDVLRYPALLTLLCLGATGLLLHPRQFELQTALLAFLSIVLMYSSVFLYNYFTDIEEDRINDTYNPVLDETYRKVLLVYIPLAVIGTLLISYQFLPNIALLVTVYFLLVGYAYSTPPFRLKETFFLKNLSIAGGMAPVLFITATSLTGTVTLLDFVVATFYSVFSFLGSTISDLRDLEGDREAGVRTIPVVMGVRGTGHIFLALSLLQVLVLVVPVGLGLLEPVFLLLLVAIPSRLRLSYRVYRLDMDSIEDAQEVPGLVLATVAVFATAVIRLGVLG